MSHTQPPLVFISQPMNGLSKEEIRKQFEEASADVRELLGPEAICVNAYTDLEPTGNVNRGVAFMEHSLHVMAPCDYIYYADGWEDSPGCRIEHLVASTYGIGTLWVVSGTTNRFL